MIHHWPFARGSAAAALTLATWLVSPLLAGSPPKPLWPPLYKIRPHEKERLTPADVVGPDGIVYPNWTKVGVQGGIPDAKPAATIEQFGGKANDKLDDSAALAKACEAVGAKGGGAVLLGEGTYYLDRPVTVRRDGVVIRGKGAKRTKLVFRYGVPPNGVGFYWPPAGSRVGKSTRLEMHCQPLGLMKMTMMVDDKVLGVWTRGRHSGGSYGYTRFGSHVVGKLPDGPHTLKGVAEYRGGKKRTGEIPIVLDSKFDDTRVIPTTMAAITFLGRGYAGPKLRLAADGKRGSTTLTLQDTGDLKAGDCVFINGPATARWKKLTRNRCKWGSYRCYELVVEKVDGKTLHLTQPLRIEFPVIDGSYVRKIVPIRRCGAEDLYLEQTEALWICGVMFSHGWNCWARGVTVKKCGRHAVYGRMAKWCEIRDCLFDDAWFKGGGGTAYVGWERSWDCLMENVTSYKMRHGPCFQWSASGNVVRKSTFHDSDGQWHAGWTNENLIEQCVIHSRRGHGSYGYGLWASPPGDTAHGPNGPRNVVYNCDVHSQRTGLWMGGMNENWLILHNRFAVARGQGVYARTYSFDHIIQGNVFVLQDRKSPMAQFATSDCTGVDLIANTLYGGSGQILVGAAKAAVLKDNRALPLPESLPARPAPAVPSIYEWQKRNVK